MHHNHHRIRTPSGLTALACRGVYGVYDMPLFSLLERRRPLRELRRVAIPITGEVLSATQLQRTTRATKSMQCRIKATCYEQLDETPC